MTRSGAGHADRSRSRQRCSDRQADRRATRFFDSSGTLHVPFGRLADFGTTPGIDVGGNLQLGNDRYCYLDGAGEVRLPAGPITVDILKGPEFTPLHRTVTLGSGQIALRFAMERWTDLWAKGWYSGDLRCHYLSPHAALLEGAAEDLAVTNLLALERPASATDPAAFSNLLAFSGTRPCLEIPGHLVAVNTLNAHPVLGTVSLLDSHRPVFPLRFGAPDKLDDWSVADWCDQCHRKRGLVVWPDLPRMTKDAPQGEALAALMLGKIDAFEISRFDSPEPAALQDWYRLLDCGVRLPLAGSSGKESNAVALGAVRTYAHLAEGQPFAFAPWIDAVKAGRTFVTNGPLLFLTADCVEPGSTLRLPTEGKRLNIRVLAESATPFDQVDVLLNGKPIATWSGSGETSLDVNESGWLAARCWGQTRLADGQHVYAHTSPIYVQVEGRPLVPGRQTVEPLVAILERTREWLLKDARCEAEGPRRHLVEVIEAGRGRLVGANSALR